MLRTHACRSARTLLEPNHRCRYGLAAEASGFWFSIGGALSLPRENGRTRSLVGLGGLGCADERRRACWSAGGRGGNRERGGRGGDRLDDPGGRAVRHGSRLDGHEHGDRDGRQGCWNHGDRDPDRDHSLHAGDGVTDDHGREGRPDDRAQAGVCDRVHHLRLRLADHRAVSESDRADDRLVGPGRAGGGADHAGDRGAGRVELRQARPSARLWARRRCGRDRGGAGAAGRRPAHYLRVVAVGVRRGGGDRAGDPRPGSPHEGHAGGGGRPA